MLRNWRNGSGGRDAGSARHPIPASAPHSAPDPAAEISRLRRENDRLRTERDILKNLSWAFRPACGDRNGFMFSGGGEGVAVSLMVAMTPSKNVAHGPLRTCEW